MSDNLAKFQSLLCELFQFDCADLDFGIYRIMNHKRAVIERWITEDLPNLVRQELQQGTLAAQQKMLEELDTVREEIQKTAENLGEKPFDADGNLLIWQDKPIGKKYIELREKAIHARNSQALEAAVYNHLYTFFSRYWQEGDFISRRRYSKKERYAIPYNGEEVFLYWANHDQYYVKTGEYFTDYTYKAPNGVTVHFKLRQADVEQNNVKGEKRFFLPRLDEITCDTPPLPKGEGSGVRVIIPFEYRPLTAQEAITYGQKNQQEVIIAKAVAEIPKRIKVPEVLAALTAERRYPGNADVSSALEYHLRQYTRRNTSDFFIHKDLKGFLSRELDFYLKNEVLNLEELEAAGEGLSEGWFQLLRLIKRVGLHIIEFLAQIEDFQKMLWEKKKFVTETFYLVTVGNIPEAFYPEIAACEAQWKEWEKFGIPGIADVTSAENADVTPASSENNLHKGWHTRGYLPHFDAGNILQFITFRLADSVPSEVIDQWKQELRWHEGMDAASKEAVELRKRIEKYEDSGKGACYLRDERIARLVENALKRFNGERYRLIAWCIMPNHVHVLIETMHEPLAGIIHSWKSYTAHEANKLLGRTGAFWSPEYFDRYIRDEDHFRATVDYILQNPVKAGLVDAPEKWHWSGFIPENAGNASVSDAGSAALAASGARAGRRDACDPRIAFLKAHPTLVVDTRHFSQDFTDRLLASFDDLDEVTDGLLVHSENWQALNLLQEKYRERVKCIYIDPPFNTDANPIVYKNDYQHSSWLSLIESRLSISRQLEAKLNPVHVVAIDDAEKNRLGLLLERIFEGREITCVSVVHNPSGTMGMNFSVTNEYALFVYGANCNSIAKEKREDAPDVRDLMNTAKGSSGNYLRSTGKTCFYPIYVKDMAIIGVGDVCPDDYHPSQNVLRDDGVIEVYPIDADGVERKWVLSRDTIEDHMDELYPKIDKKSGKIRIERRKTAINYKTVWDNPKYSAKKYGTELLGEIILGTRNMARLYPKSVHLVMDCIHAGSTNMTNCLIADYFAGSGTTGHAVIALNREDGGRRKFILVEMADYFDTVLLPRIKKVAFTPEWKDGKPKRMATQEEAERSPRIVKVIRLESYEDALNNLTFEEQSSQQALELFRDDYLLSYMLRWETRHSETLLNVEKLQAPFSYKLHLHRDGETRQRPVDLPETFAYLLGLDVQTRRVYPGNAGVSPAQYLVYRGRLRNGRTVVILWRDITGWGVEDYEREAAFVAQQNLIAGADEIYVNGDSRIPGARSLDPIFKERMFAPVEV